MDEIPVEKELETIVYGARGYGCGPSCSLDSEELIEQIGKVLVATRRQAVSWGFDYARQLLEDGKDPNTYSLMDVYEEAKTELGAIE